MTHFDGEILRPARVVVMWAYQPKIGAGGGFCPFSPTARAFPPLALPDILTHSARPTAQSSSVTMSEIHDIRLKIDASAARQGSKEFTSAIAAIKRAVKDLERDSAGAFTALSKSPKPDLTGIKATTNATDGLSRSQQHAADMFKRLQIASQTALRTSQNDVSRLSASMAMIGDNSGLAELEGALTRLQGRLATATNTTDIRSARADFKDLADEVKRTQLAAVSTGKAMQGMGANARVSGFQTAYMASQFNDIAVMMAAGQNPLQLALQQGTQVSQMLNGLGTRAAILRTLSAGFMSMINPVSLVTIGVIALGAALFQALTGADDEVKSFADALGDANNHISALRSASTNARNGIGDMVDGYGRLNAELDKHLDRLVRVEKFRAMGTNRDMVQSIQDSIPDGWLTTASDGLKEITGGTYDAVRQIEDLMTQVKNATTFEDQSAALTRLRQRFEEVSGGFDNGSDSAKDMLAQIIEAEDASIRLARSQDDTSTATDRSSKAANALAIEIGTGADEAARLLATVANMPSAFGALQRSIGQQISDMERANASLRLQIGGGYAAAAADRQVQLDDFIAAGAKSGNLNLDEVAKRAGDIARLNELAKEGAALQKKLSDSMKSDRSGGGKGRQSDLQKYNESLKDTLQNLRAQELAHKAIADSTFQSAEASKLYGEAAVLMGGQVDAATMAILRQIDAQTRANREAAAANDPVKAFLESVPTYQEAANTIKSTAIDGLKNSFEELFKTGEFGAKSFADSMVSALASVLADQTTKAFLQLFGFDGSGSGVGGGILNFLFPAHSEGGFSDRPAMSSAHATMAAFSHAPHFAQGTANTSGIPSILHPNEAVIPLSKGRKVPVEMNGGDAANGNAAPVINMGPITANVTVEGSSGDPAADQKHGGQVAKAVVDQLRAMVQEQIAHAARYGGTLNPRG
ncbi:phage tail length tape measure family protein [Defluviimonas sp. SAOS-178_SWC]|uniref:phage tail length tape measure family protein n=1 Tax=Defluviimonas sp. SAOS-178_SWC TaxID=3121287 RepID=UPI00322157E9